MDLISTDIVIVGAGGAGLRAAIAVAETDASLNISLLSKVCLLYTSDAADE